MIVVTDGGMQITICRCTHNALCRAHRAILELQTIAMDLRRAGFVDEARRIGAVAGGLRKKLTKA